MSQRATLGAKYQSLCPAQGSKSGKFFELSSISMFDSLAVFLCVRFKFETVSMQDYYATLGVLPSAEEAVIKGAYKAMMSLYHPDKYKGDKAFAHAKSLEIQEAYAVLKDKAKRAAYDETLGVQHDYTEEQQEAQASCDEEQKINAEHWQYALKYHPELAALEQELAQLSPSLAMQFRLALIENKQFSQADVLSLRLSKEYIQRFFGDNLDIQAFARELLTSRHREAAKELNKAINFLGADADTDKLILSIRQEFGVAADAQQRPTNHQDVKASPWEGNTSSKDSKGSMLDGIPFPMALSGTLLVLMVSLQPHTMGGFVDFIFFVLFILGCRTSYRSYKRTTKIR